MRLLQHQFNESYNIQSFPCAQEIFYEKTHPSRVQEFEDLEQVLRKLAQSDIDNFLSQWLHGRLRWH